MNVSIWIRGGGMRSVTYAGFLAGIEHSEKYNITNVIGNSGGAVIASMFALQMPMKNVVKYFQEFNPYSAITDHNYDNWLNYGKAIFGDAQIEKTKIPLSIQAYCKNQKKIVFFDKGEINTAVIASSAVIKPFKWNDNLYLDSNELQTFDNHDTNSNTADKNIIIQTSLRNRPFFESVIKKIHLATIEKANLQHSQKPNYSLIEISIPRHSMVDKTKLDELFKLGYEQGMRFTIDN